MAARTLQRASTSPLYARMHRRGEEIGVEDTERKEVDLSLDGMHKYGEI